MKRMLKMIPLFFFLTFLWLFSFQCAAAITYTKIPDAALKNVLKAEKVTGVWSVSESGVKKFLPVIGEEVDEETGEVTGQTYGKYLKNQWICFEGEYFYLNKQGSPVTGWATYNKNVYYMNRLGAMVTGWFKNKTYYFKNNGTLAKGPVKIDGEYYYFNDSTGKKMTGWITFRNKKYYFSPQTGKKVRSKWIQDKTHWKYVDDKGVMQTSTWIYIGTKKYYVDNYGYRVTGEQYIGGKWYFFRKNGTLNPNKKVGGNIDPTKKMVALTFDDGPGPYTSSLLDCLRANNARATFFMVGSSVSSYSSVVKKMFAQHCELGNHSYSHAEMTALGSSSITSEFSRTSEKIKEACGAYPTVARLPYGSGHNNSRVLSAIGLPSIFWSIDTEDWANTGNPSHTVAAVLNYVKNGDIVLMHDIHASSVQAAKTIIPALKSRGFQMVTVSELAKYKGKTALSRGRTYYNFY